MNSNATRPRLPRFLFPCAFCLVFSTSCDAGLGELDTCEPSTLEAGGRSVAASFDEQLSEARIAIDNTGATTVRAAGGLKMRMGVCPGRRCDIGLDVGTINVDGFAIGEAARSPACTRLSTVATAFGTVEPDGSFVLGPGALQLEGFSVLELDGLETTGFLSFQNVEPVGGRVDYPSREFSMSVVVVDTAFHEQAISLDVNLSGDFTGPIPPAPTLIGLEPLTDNVFECGVEPVAVAAVLGDADGDVTYQRWTLKPISSSDGCDNCGILGDSESVAFFVPLGTFELELLAIDNDSMSSRAHRIIRGQDTLPPVPDAPILPDLATTVGVPLSAPIPTATDECLGESTLGTSPDPMTFSSPGLHEITWTYDDGRAHTSTQRQAVVVSP